MIVVSALLAMLSRTGIVAHIAIFVVGLVIMIPITIATRNEWMIPALEVIMCVRYLIAVLTSGALMTIRGVPVLGIIHKIGAVAFAVLMLVLYLPKWKQ